MYAMQYRVPLPADYDMGIIRERVRTTGHLMDGFIGLEFKAYLIQEKARGAPSNTYAPFYVWRNIDGMRAFCWGDPGYSSIVRDFGRHPIQDWTLHRLVNGPADYDQTRSLTVKTVGLSTKDAPGIALQNTTEHFLTHVSDTTVALVTAVDVTTWNLILVELTTQEVDHASVEADTVAYDVLHLSTSA